MNRHFVINNIEEIEKVAGDFLSYFEEDRIFAFYGEMGVGKTTFIKSLCKILGAEIPAKSPTFAIVNSYPAGEDEIYHFDCYRIESIKEFVDIGYEEYLNSNSYCFIEWAENVEEVLPEETIRVQISLNTYNLSRVIQVL